MVSDAESARLLTNGMRQKQKNTEHHILVIDDNDDQCTIIRTVIEQNFSEVVPVFAANEKEALAYLEDNAENTTKMPRLILLDLYLPGREDGLALLQRIKESGSYFRFPPIVILSASKNLEDIEESYLVGCSSYLVKPNSISQWQELFLTLKSYWLKYINQ